MTWILWAILLSTVCGFVPRSLFYAPRNRLRYVASSQHASVVWPHVQALSTGRWVKFISGASNQDLPLVRNLCYLYTLAGVDCIDIRSDPAVLQAATAGMDQALSAQPGVRPLLMISVNAGEDNHFRKVYFDPEQCPADCPRPCERVCPAWAISREGVAAGKCYGCGRCIPICPLGLIDARAFPVEVNTVRSLLASDKVQALEIHVHADQLIAFADLWSDIHQLACAIDVLSLSFNDMGPSTWSSMMAMQAIIESSPSYFDFKGVQIWQTDGRSMSGDIGKGTVHVTHRLAQAILQEASAVGGMVDFNSRKHFVQLAGGTNDHSIVVAKRDGLFGTDGFGGFAFGGYARKRISQQLFDLSNADPAFLIEDHPHLLRTCLEFAKTLVNGIKDS